MVGNSRSSGRLQMPLTWAVDMDLAKFIVAALDLERWESGLSCNGNRITLKEFVKLTEKTTSSKFNMMNDPAEKLQKRENTELPSHRSTYASFLKLMIKAMLVMFGLYVVNVIFEMPQDGESSNKRSPDIEVTVAEEAISLWKGSSRDSRNYLMDGAVFEVA